ncbi:hypothetical protein P5673_012714 [Acropora cervicornis]|uniref:Uncharacterized protein n=1 Tax=Acropora cervicornis TaxID=6130 RepID=A0AAD9QLW0_ACRCE|nr:hypothetical protein P5673_012714 [Acropora cervicornis]
MFVCLSSLRKALDMFKRNRVPIPTYHALNDILVKASQEKDEVKVKMNGADSIFLTSKKGNFKMILIWLTREDCII